MRRRALLVLLASLVASVARGEEALPGHTLVLDHGGDPSAPCAMPGGARHDGRLAYALPTTAPTARVVHPLPGTRTRGPVIDAAGRIYVATPEGVRIVAPEGGADRLVLGEPLDAAPVIVPGGDVIALARDGRFTRFSPDGTVRARAMTSLGVRFSPLVEDDGSLVVVGASRTLAVVGSDLEVRGTRELPDGLALGATRTANGLWAVPAGSELVFVDTSTLAITRVLPLPGRAATPAALAPDGTVWLATVEGELCRATGALRLVSMLGLGARLPEATTSDRAMLGIAPDGDVLVVVPARGLVRATPDGEERWVWASETPLIGAVAVDAEGRAAVVDRVGHLSVLSPSGESIWSVALESLPLGPPIVTAQGRIVILTEHGVVLLGPS